MMIHRWFVRHQPVQLVLIERIYPHLKHHVESKDYFHQRDFGIPMVSVSKERVD